MRRALLLLAMIVAATGAVPPTPASAEDVDPSQAVLVEVLPQRTTWFVGERAPLRLRIEYDAAFFERSVVQSFRRELDVPLRVSARWLDRARPASSRVDGAVSIAAGDAPLAMERSTARRGGRTFGVLERRLVLDARDVGDIDLSVDVEFTYATAFRDDFVEGRVARDARRVRVPRTGPVVRVLPLPDAGRPDDFSGGVGVFEIEAHLVSAEFTEDGRVAATVRVVLLCEPAARAEGVQFPPLRSRPGLHVLGGRREYARRTENMFYRSWLWEVEVSAAALRAIPPVAFSFFDPREGGRYVTIETGALELPVRAPEEEPEPEPGPGPVAPRPPSDADSAATGFLAALAALLLLLAAGVALVLRRRRASSASRTTSPAAAGEWAAAEARAALDDPGVDVADVLATFLARRLGCAPAAVVSPDLPRRLEAAGVAPEVAREMSQLQERLVAARYGGAAPTAADRAAVLALLH